MKILLFGCCGIIAYMAPVFAERESGNPSKEMAIKSYLTASGWKERRRACLDLIDAGVIARGVRLDSLPQKLIDKMFISKGTIKSACIAIIHFEDQPPRGTSSTGASDWVGWYLTIETDKTGSIENYTLSDLHK